MCTCPPSSAGSLGSAAMLTAPMPMTAGWPLRRALSSMSGQAPALAAPCQRCVIPNAHEILRADVQ